MRNARFLFVMLWVVATAFADEPGATPAPKPNVDRLLKRLNSEDHDTICDALRDLEIYDGGRALLLKPRLIELARSSNKYESESAIGLLAEIGPKAADALPVLETRLNDPLSSTRFAAADAVWRIGGRADQAAAIFIAGMKENLDATEERSRAWECERAGSYLSDMGPDAAVALPLLLKRMDDPSEIVRRETASVLGSLGSGNVTTVEPRLLAALNDPAGRVRLAAARALGALSTSLPRAVETMIELTKEEIPPSDKAAKSVSSETFLASSAAEALGELESDAALATTTLIVLLKSPALAVRLHAATALGRIGPAAKDAIPALTEALQETESHSFPFVHRSWCVGDNAAEALANIGVGATPALLKALEDRQPAIRAAAAAALGKIPASAAQSVPFLARRLEDSDAFVRIETAKALAQLGPAAVEATPELVRLLVDNRGVTSFRAGSGLGINESTSEEAWRALLSLKPDASQVIPPLVEALKDADGLSGQAIFALRKFAAEAAPAKKPLERLLEREKTRVAAACALAFVAPDHEQIQPVLQEAVFENGRSDPLALLGIKRLAASDRTFDDEFRTRLRRRAEDDNETHLWECVFCLMPDDDDVTTSFVTATLGHFGSTGEVEEAASTMIARIDSHPRLKRAIVEALDFELKPEKEDDFDELQYNFAYRGEAAKVLLTTRIEVARAVDCLTHLIDDHQELGEVFAAEFLSKEESPPREMIPLISTMLDFNGWYSEGRDFYGNGGKRTIIGDRAAMALVTLKASGPLIEKVESRDAEVRARVVRALGELDGEDVVSALLGRVKDSDNRVRRDTIEALGRFGQRNSAVRARLKPVLQAAADNDVRRNIRGAAANALAQWSVEM